MRIGIAALLFALAVLACATAPAAGGGRLAEVVQDGTSVRYELYDLQLEATGNWPARNVLIAYQPDTRLAWWVSSSEADVPGFTPSFPERLILTASNIGRSERSLVVFFVTGAFPTLFADESTARFASAADPRQHIAGLFRHSQYGTDSTRRRVNVNLAAHLDPGFRFSKDGSPPNMTIPRVGRSGGRWVVTLRGPNGDLADVTLTDDYELIDVRRHS